MVLRRAAGLAALSLALSWLLEALPAVAQETADEDEQLGVGSEVYLSVCAACHQPTGAGIPGSFPPLLGNPAVDDAAYVEEVIRNGRRGELVVNGVTYDAVMPAQSTLTDEEIAAVIAYIQAGFVVPGVESQQRPTSGTAGTGLPAASTATFGLAFLLAAALAAMVITPRLIGPVDRLRLPWFDAWLKTAAIVLYFVLATVVLPSRLLQSSLVREMPRAGQDVLASLIWLFALILGLLALWIAHRQDRI